MADPADKILARIKAGDRILADGAWGTVMQQFGLQPGECPEEWNVTQPDRILKIARDYLKAGADIILSNTFGGTHYRLVRHGFADKVREFNLAGAKLSRQAADEFGGFVAASVGPTGEFVEPEGMLKEREMYDAFRKQIAALKEGGAHGICIETMYVVEEAVIAVRAARDQGMFTIACMTFEPTEDGFRTMLGSTVEEATRALDTAGADVIGTNCGSGIADMVRLASRMRLFTQKPMIVKSNAGLPDMSSGAAVYSETPDFMAQRLDEFRRIGVNIIGGCCGTTPEHIKAFRQRLDAAK